MHNPMYNLSYAEQKEYSILRKKLSDYISDISIQRSEKINGTKRKELEIDHSKCPSDDEFFRSSELWWKAFS